MIFKPDSTLLIQIQIALLGIVMIAGLFYLWRIILRLEERIDNLCKNNICQNGMPPFQIPPQFADENSQDDIAIAQELMQQVFGGIGSSVGVGGVGGIGGVGGGPNIIEQPTMMMFSTTLPMQIPNPSDILSKKCVVEEIPTSEPTTVDVVEPETISHPSLNTGTIPTVGIHNETHYVKNENTENAGNTKTEIEHIIEEIDNSTNISEEDDGNPISKTKLNQMKIEKLRKLCKDRGISTEGVKTQLIDRLLGLTRE